MHVHYYLSIISRLQKFTRPHETFFGSVSANTVYNYVDIIYLKFAMSDYKLVGIPSHFSSFNLIGHRKFEMYDAR